MRNISIIWWSDGFWKWLAYYINKNFKKDINITITWRNIEKLKKRAKEIWCSYSDNNIKTIKTADIIIFAVPIWVMEETIKNLLKYAKKDSIILDITSIKDGPSKVMFEYAPKDSLVIPTHPMFWPYVSTIAWQIFVLTPREKDKANKKYLALKKYLEENDAKVIETSAIEHDKMMAVVQWLTHFDMFVLWETIKRLNLDIKKSMDFVSPIYKIMISSVARYLNQNPKLYSDIQIYNKEILWVHNIFMEVTNDFNNYIKNKDEKSFIDKVEKTADYFGKYTIEWQEYTDKIIYLISKQIEKCNNNMEKNISIENIYTNQIISWVLTNFENNIITVDNKKYNLNTWEIK